MFWLIFSANTFSSSNKTLLVLEVVRPNGFKNVLEHLRISDVILPRKIPFKLTFKIFSVYISLEFRKPEILPKTIEKYLRQLF